MLEADRDSVDVSLVDRAAKKLRNHLFFELFYRCLKVSFYKAKLF